MQGGERTPQIKLKKLFILGIERELYAELIRLIRGNCITRKNEENEMKRRLTLGMVLLLAISLLTSCGGKKETVPNVDLTACFDQMMKDAGFDEFYMTDLEGEMLESYYPGLSEIPTKQFLAKAPMMSGVVNEVVLMQCENEDDAAKAVAILQQRVTDQAEGGAWYPESMEAWSRGQVIQNGTYVAMIASANFQSTWADDFNALFA